MKIIILNLLLLTVASALPDTFHFTQCECPNSNFSSEQKNNFVEPLVRDKNPDRQLCPGNSTFPTESGVILDCSQIRSLLTTTVSSDLFQDRFTRRNKVWHAAFKLSLREIDPHSGSFFLIDIPGQKFKIRFDVQPDKDDGGSRVNIWYNNDSKISLKLKHMADNSLDIVVGKGFRNELALGHKRHDFAFFCGSANGDETNCGKYDVDNHLLSASSTRLDLLEHSVGAPPVHVKLSAAHFDNGATGHIITNDEAVLLNELVRISREIVAQMPEVISLPIIVESKSFTTKAETDHTFNFFQSSNTVSSDIIVLPKQAPVAQNFEFNVFATIGREISVEVATDVDQIDGKMDGILTFDNTISGLISSSCESSVPITELPVVDGSVSFCYAPDETMIDGESDTLLFTVTDKTSLHDRGFFHFNGNTPLFVADENPIEIGNEDAPLKFFLGRDRFGKTAAGVPEDVLVGIRVTRLPDPAHGTLIDSKGNNIDLITNSDFLSNEKLTFVPASGVFNAVNESPQDSAENLVGTCSQRVEINGNEGMCPISFEYKVFLGELETNSTEAFFIISAVDDGNPQITVKGGNEATFESNFLSDVAITSGDNVFQIKMQISSSEGLEFKISFPSNPIGFDSTRGMNHDDTLVDCALDSCAFVNVLGVPSQLEEVANNLLIDSVPEDGFPFITFEVVSFSESFGDGSSITAHFTSEESTGGSYAGGVIGGSVGGVVILAIIVGVGVYCREKKRKENLKHELNGNMIVHKV